MDTRNCCSGCTGVDNVYSCSNPIRRASIVPTQPMAVKKEEPVSQGFAATPAAVVTVKKEEKVKV
ncbi:hypothetical protein ACS0TY_027785 [Phlomoides rotata]